MKDSDRQRLASVEKRLDRFYETITSFEDQLFCEEFKSKVATFIDSIEFFCRLRNAERAENEVTKLEACIDKFVKDIRDAEDNSEL